MSTTLEKQGTISTLDQTGDFKVTWNHENQAEIDIAKKSFEELKRKKYASFRMRPDGSRGEQISEFDPRAEQIIMVPPMAGG